MSAAIEERVLQLEYRFRRSVIRNVQHRCSHGARPASSTRLPADGPASRGVRTDELTQRA
eukprot:3718913-Prymnesium_polylepis.1